MTIERALRTRAKQARRTALVCSCAAISILIAVYGLMPAFIERTFDAIVRISETIKLPVGGALNVQSMTIITIGMGVSLAALASYLLAKAASSEKGFATRCSGLADALCLAGNDLVALEKVAPLFLSVCNRNTNTGGLPVKDIKAILDLRKELHI